MSETRFSKDHEWVRLEGDIATIGITQHAAEQLGDVVFVELPEVGRRLVAHGEAAVVESVKAASDVFAPLGGEVLEVNAALTDDPAGVNADPQGAAWFFKLRIADRGEFESLMRQGEYDAFVKEA